MIRQYSDSYGTISADIQGLIANKISVFDRYILMQTGQYEYTALVYNPATKSCKQYRITRGTNNYNNYYSVAESNTTFDYTVTNEYYVFSNVGYGKSLDLPVYEGVISWSFLFIAILSAFAVVFKGALFKWLKRR